MDNCESSEISKFMARRFAQIFTMWVRTASNIEFWVENNGEEQLAEMLTEFMDGMLEVQKGKP